jgi:colanic acid/amylovoran biosynthesis glycosyltransferase
MEHLLSDDFYLQKAVYSKGQLFNIEIEQAENAAIAKRLINDKVELILAEFGTMGGRLVDVATMTGIPIVVIFYGYDAWHQSALEENTEKYQQLFSQAAQVIGVSRDICLQLDKLGCPKEKIIYLPCYIDLDKFAFVPREFTEPRFLSVGRFCQTKAPQLTILAFSEVLKKLPNANLIMIGADDGNGVLESCKTLVNSLKINGNIDFLGSCSVNHVYEEMKKASIFVQHSVTTPETGDKEGTPVAIMEAMASGLPVISTRHAGILEMIEHGATGKLVNEFDYLEMAEEMVTLIQDKEALIRIGMAASGSIRANPLVANHTTRLTEIIDKHIIHL